jgi:DegV family protein with EDD domain
MSNSSLGIVVDSTADISPEEQQNHGIKVIPLRIQFGSESFLDGVEIRHDEFYQRLADDKQLPTTAAPSPGAFIQVYEEVAQKHGAILSIHMTGKMSSTVQVAQQAARQVMDDMPQARIEVIDSQQISVIMTYMALAAAEAAQQGKGLDEVVPLVCDIASRGFIYVGFESLHHLERGGRIGHVRAFLGTLLRVKPLAALVEGELQPLERVRTTKRMLARLVDLTREQGDLAELAVLYAVQREMAEKLREQLAETGIIAPERIRLIQVGGVIGTHTGPDSLGIAGLRSA